LALSLSTTIFDKEEVVAHLRGAVSRVRNNPEALQMLYNLCQRAGESSMIAEILELQAHACVQNEQFERARDAYKELIELEPENSSHIQGYHQVCARISNDSPAPAITPTTSVEPRTLEEFLIGEEPELPVQNYTPEMEEVIATALTEAELCESFSSKKRGIDALEHALLSAPEDLRLNRTLALLYRQQGDPAKAAGCYVTMQRVLEGLGEIEGAAYYASAVGPDQSATTTWEAKGSEFAASDFNNSEDLAGGVGSAEEIDLSNEWESVWQEVADEPEPSAVPPFTVPMSSNSSSSASVGMSEMLEEVRFCLAQQIWSEAETGIARIAAVFPEHPELVSLRTQLWQGRSGAVSLPVVAPTPAYQPIEVIEVGSDPSSSSLSSPAFPPIPQTAVVPPAPAFTLDSLAAELDSELGDVFEPAPPHRPAATPRAVEHTAQPSAPLPYTPPPAALQPLAPPAEELVPFLAAEVAGPIAPSVFGDLLQDFEQDLAAPQDNDSDPETHFNLGIAFREMGLLDEAIGELQKVCRVTGQGMSAARAQQAYIWLATCFVEKDVPEASFKWFIRALDAAPDEDSRTAVNYELASAYEAAGRKREALDHFLEVYGTNIDYRDVASRIRELRSVV
jgi:tetratricopeptide (TPR) repeat protein